VRRVSAARRLLHLLQAQLNAASWLASETNIQPIHHAMRIVCDQITLFDMS
jgi:hypothetical protein